MLLFTVLSLLAVAPEESISAGTSLTFRGHFVAEKGEAAATEKQFEVTYFLTKHEDGTASGYWSSDERGRGGWSWLDRFGKWEFGPKLRPTGGIGPTLSYERPDGINVIPLPAPFLTYTEPFSVGMSWFEGPLEFRVAAEEKVGDAKTWRIEVRSPIGRKRVVWVEQNSPTVLAFAETVFIGQGEQHELKLELTSRTVQNSKDADTTIAAFEEFLRLRERLGVAPQSRELRWNSERLAILKADLPTVTEKAAGTSLEKLAKAADQDSKNQKERAGALGAIQNKLIGRASPQPAIETIAGEKFAWKDLQGKVTVLHFWDYRDMPLEEPYGQVAYLDFLARQHTNDDVKVFGVVADERVTQPDTKRAGIQSAKKLQSFMNLSYPLLVDSGTAVKEFGDPRATGAKLPLFVVIDRQGNVVHYHAGHYEVNRDRGLEELGKIIRQALEKS
jgi:peroxiredoxin